MVRLLGSHIACPRCGGGLPGEVHDDAVCKCGTDNGLGAADWAWIEQMLMLRSGNRCEIRSPACLGGEWGDLTRLPRHRRSIHHRRPRGMGGTRRADVHSLAMLVNACGDGVIGCHGYVERHREWATNRGLLLPKDGIDAVSDPTQVVLVLPSGRRVLLAAEGPLYLPPPDGVWYDLNMRDTPDEVAADAVDNR